MCVRTRVCARVVLTASTCCILRRVDPGSSAPFDAEQRKGEVVHVRSRSSGAELNYSDTSGCPEKVLSCRKEQGKLITE